jgi:ArsR family transcriptional regulator, arsenate/arsenite/antimonite-responsive transcriptional repressor
MAMPDQATTAKLAKLLRVLGDPTRLAIFDLLMQGVQCNCEIGENLHLPMNLISHHLKALREAGLVGAERDAQDGRWVYYSVDPRTLIPLREQLGAFLDPKRIRPRQPNCGPRVIPVDTVHTRAR